MREDVVAGTDVAALGVGDPSLLEPLRACEGRRYADELAKAVESGAFWHAESDADGSYLFHVFVDEEPPATLSAFLHDPIDVETFRVPSGRLRVAGEECFTGAIQLADYPHMGREIQVAPGDYRFRVWRVEAPDGFVEARFAQTATPAQQRAWTRGNGLPAWCFLLTIAALVAGYFIYLRTVSAALALAPLALAAAAWWGQVRYRRGAVYRSAEKVFREIERELPSLVIVLRRQGGP